MPAFAWSLRAVAPQESPRAKLDRLLAIKDEGEVTRSLMQARCDRGAEIARMIGLTDGTAEAIRTLDEHWDGHGQPRWLARRRDPAARPDPLPRPDRGDLPCRRRRRRRLRGRRAARGHLVRPRPGEGARAPSAGQPASGPRSSEPDLTRWEPADQLIALDDERLLQIATAFAAIVDAKSPWTYFHSDRTSLIATNIGAALGLDAAELGDLRHMGLLHDIGKLAVSNRILDKPSELTAAEYARIKEHPLFTRWVLERVSCFEELAAAAAGHHERLDGSGYPSGLTPTT